MRKQDNNEREKRKRKTLKKIAQENDCLIAEEEKKRERRNRNWPISPVYIVSVKRLETSREVEIDGSYFCPL